MPRSHRPARSTPTAPSLAARPRRLRRSPRLRDWVAETDLDARHLVLPVLVRAGGGTPTPVPSLPAVARWPVEALPELARDLNAAGVPAVLLFGQAERKYGEGREAWSPRSVVAQAVGALKAADPELIVVTDVCLCAYTAHGHCGIVRNGHIDNDATVERLARTAVAHARAGADLVAPSAMMDGQVAGVRAALDVAGFTDRGILSYATKHASAFYGPFREAEGSRPSFGDRTTYQMDPRNAREALRELRQDVAEGADIVMVKPALTSLDLLARARRRVDVPLAAYQVSGEYAMLKSGARSGAFPEREAVLETLTAIRRAGADLIVSYYARDVAAWLRRAP